MNPSSSRSDAEPFGFLVARGSVAAATTATAWLQALLDAEAALVLAQAEVGEVPGDAALAIADACRAETFDAVALFTAAEAGGNPVIPLVPMLREAVGAEDAEYVHRGATSQDIFDTAAMLIVGRCSDSVVGRLADVRLGVEELSARCGTTPMIGRTLGQHAAPTTFASVTGAWRTGVEAASTALAKMRQQLPVQLGGPVGDATSFGARASDIRALMARRTGLMATPDSWHTQRTPIAGIAGAWGLAAAAVGSVAVDIVVLAQSDVGELAERAQGAGGSSSMPHKQNPIAAVSARAAAMQAPGLVATLLHSAGGEELHRAAGGWHAEWPAMQALVRCTGSAVEWLATSVDRLVIDKARMHTNIGEPPCEVESVP